MTFHSRKTKLTFSCANVSRRQLTRTVILLLFITMGLLWFGELVRHSTHGYTPQGSLTTLDTPAITLQALNATSYQLQAIAKTGDTIDGKTLTGFSEIGAGFPERLSINDRGQVVFIGDFQGGKGVFINNSLIAATGETFGGDIVTFVNAPTLNNSGHVIFRGAHQHQSGRFAKLFSQSGVFLEGADFGNPTLNNSGLVAFNLSSVASSVFTQNGLLVSSSGTIGGISYAEIYGYSLSDSGELAFTVGSVPRAVFTQNRLIAAAGDTIGGVSLTGFSLAAPAINDHGVVAFQGFFEEGTGIFTQNAKVAGTGDIIDGVTLTDINAASSCCSGGPLSINASGEVAFRSSGIVFTQNSIVAKPGDIVGELTLTGIIGDPVINHSGQIAFLASYPGGSVLVLATPDHPCKSQDLLFFHNAVITVVNGLAMEASFTPGNGCTLDEVAKANGYSHFNWVGTVTNDPYFDKLNPPQVAVPYLDPPHGGGQDFSGCADDFDFYYDEILLSCNPLRDRKQHISVDNRTLLFQDEPGDPRLKETEFLGFETTLVGVRRGSKSYRPLDSFGWKADIKGTSITRSSVQSTNGEGRIFDVIHRAKLEEAPLKVKELWATQGGEYIVTERPSAELGRHSDRFTRSSSNWLKRHLYDHRRQQWAGHCSGRDVD